ncbi:MAG TPA: helix-turn-helix transcriptional regulator [Usitatibacter sp.]
MTNIPVPRIEFDRAKYGCTLLADAARIDDIPGFITEPRSHRLGFYEIALIREGRGCLELDDAALPVAPRAVLVTAPGEVRRWRLEGPRFEGLLVFFEADFVADLGAGRLLESLPLLLSPPSERAFAPAHKAFDELSSFALRMREELRAPRRDTEHALRAETYRLLVSLQRAAEPTQREAHEGATAARARSRRLFNRFTALVEERFHEEHEVRAYATLLGVAARRLGQCAREASGLHAREVIHRRQFLEARRLLVHTEMSVAAIAEHLGFSETSYFIRFFKRYANATPLAFRTRHPSDISAHLRDLSRTEGPSTMAG